MNIRWCEGRQLIFINHTLLMRKVQTLNRPPSLLPTWSDPDQNLIRPLRETESTQQLSCDVVFGSPSADCMGTGICRITARTQGSPSGSQRKQHCRSTVGLLFSIEGGRGVSLVLTRALLCTRLYKTHLRHGILTLDTPCQLPKEISKLLGLKINGLPNGKYPIHENENFLRINFK